MEKIYIHTTKNKEVVDVTDHINKILAGKKREGICHLFLPHSTAGLTTAIDNNNYELDLIDAFNIALPHFKEFGQRYTQSHIYNRLPDHIISSFLGTSLSVPVIGKKSALSEFQCCTC
ncbi:MAG: hypothetical protein KatS3mg089_0329 [Patescibacteria group bacterium]|nr:MAG: hypothetical protein KatS3mg089_0329 [Patescibacteria group bacterium]